jgi:hypothetical protein
MRKMNDRDEYSPATKTRCAGGRARSLSQMTDNKREMRREALAALPPIFAQ